MDTPSDVRSRPALTLGLAGDVMLGRTVDEMARAKPAEWPWGDICDELLAADLTLVNLECQIASGGSPWTETPRVFHFRAGPHAIAALQAAGIDCVTLANNHALDFGREALLETLQRLDAAGIAHVGAGRDAAEAAQPVILERQGIRVGILGVCDDPPEYAAGSQRAGTHRIDIDSAGLDYLVGALGELQRKCDLTVLSIHWGPNMRLAPTEEFVSFAHHLADAGLDLLHGHSAHVFQGVQWRRDSLLLYDSGDFLDDYAVDPALRNDWGLFYRVGVEGPGDGSQAPRKARLLSLEVHPVFLDFCRTRRAREEELPAIRSRLEALCRPFGSRLTGSRAPWRIVPA